MRPTLALLLNKKYTLNIFNARKQIVDAKFGKYDTRSKVLPHITIIYFEESLTKEKIEKIIQQLNNLQIKHLISLNVTEITDWGHKIVAMFDASLLQNIKDEAEKLIIRTKIKYNVEYKKTYGDTIGDHMKLARQIFPNKIDKTINLLQNTLPSKVNFERIALIGYGSEEKDILWERKLPK